ncbi:MerR family transcriptional regulator [Paenibacillus abyssi]|uniref:HTH-type transcriptional repressor CarH n=1 Tax=Paenibacillus abyssi TaxID=1340531 RepID=A0A917FY04_9BACL|nr:cobalamin B12-binding domain-containing protein [Paenibacillus abyssi]GGG13033.1 HTH-type transcriptional repressor CarH [Paenibacillus abyssi]
MTQRLFTIKEVAMQTGLSTQLIRKWEERYRAVAPERMANGYRGYSKQDIDILRWLKKRVDAGVPIGMAVLEQQNPEGEAHAGAESQRPMWTISPDEKPAALEWQEPIEQLLDYFEKLDLNGAQRLYEQLVSIHHMEHILMEILEPALIELGERWARHEISEYQEHFGSHFIRDKLLALRNLFRPSPDSPLLVTACGPGERHELGILFIGFFALQLGYRVIYLGASPSEKGIFDCLAEMKPDAFTFSFATTPPLEAALPFLKELDRKIAEVSPHTMVFIGGRAIGEEGLLPGTQRVYRIRGNARLSVEMIKSRLTEK